MIELLDDPFTRIERATLWKCIPLRAVLELTYRCNFRCVHCYLVEFRSPGEMGTEEMRAVMDQLAAMGCLVLTFTGGEPLLRRDFFELAEHARRRRFALRIFTNGTLIDREAADRLRDLRPLSTEVSLYGASEETYAAVTGRPGRCERVKEAIRLLRERGLPVEVKMPVLRENLRDVEAVRAFALEAGARFTANPNITPRDDGDMSPTAHALSDEELEAYIRRWVAPTPPRQRDPDGLMCNTGRNGLVISPTGDVFPCVGIKQAVGNLRQRPLADIWAGAGLLDELRGLRVRHHAGCSGCGAPGSPGQCGPGQCAGTSFAATGSFTGGDPLARRMAAARERAFDRRE